MANIKNCARPDKAEFERRMLAIQGWMVEGVPSALIVQQILAKEWAKSERHAFILVQKGRARWVKYEDDNLDEKRKMKVQELKNRIRGLNNIFKGTPQGLRTILMYEKEIIKLEGIAFNPMKLLPTAPPSHEDIPPANIHDLQPSSDIDYSQLSDEVLQALYNAKKPEQL